MGQPVATPLFGLIHFPLFFVNGGLNDNARPQGVQVLEYAFYLLVLFSVPVRILITWLFNSTGGSLPVVALLHASIDTTASGAVSTGSAGVLARRAAPSGRYHQR